MQRKYELTEHELMKGQDDVTKTKDESVSKENKFVAVKISSIN